MPRLIIANDNPRNRVMTDLTIAQAVEILRGNPSTQFAANMVLDYDRYRDRISGNKAAWILVMAQQILDRRDAPPAPREHLGNLEELAALFRLAGTRLQFPKVELDTADGRTVVLALAGPNSRYHGQINVSSGHKYGDPAGRFYGRIATDGTTGVGDAGVLELLRRFAADPAGVAAEYGRRTGQCCFCRQGLSDERSLAVGYGPTCAKNYDLPWGTRPGRDDRPTAGQLAARDQREADLRSKAQFAVLERQRELEGFASDPDFRAHEAGTPLALEDLLEAAAAVATRDGYLPPRAERLVAAGADSAPWRDDD